MPCYGHGLWFWVCALAVLPCQRGRVLTCRYGLNFGRATQPWKTLENVLLSHTAKMVAVEAIPSPFLHIFEKSSIKNTFPHT